MRLTFNPPFPLAEATLLAMLLVAGGCWLAWRGTRSVSGPRRTGLLALRALGLGLLAFMFLNPGYWRSETLATQREWLVLVDRSGSMKTDERPKTSRWAAAQDAATTLRKQKLHGSVRVRTFAQSLEPEREEADLSALTPDGPGTGLGETLTAALAEGAHPLAGIVLLTDGRATTQAKLASLAQRARGRGIPIFPVPFGSSTEPRDLSLTAAPRQVIAFAGQPIRITARVQNSGLGPIKPAITLRGPQGAEIAQQRPALEAGAAQTVTFELPENARNPGAYALQAEAQPGEFLRANNADQVRVQILNSRLRVLLLEGAPYWDSKFLAQLLRQQQAMEVVAVHRLNEERYFRVEAAGAKPLSSPDTVLPEQAEGLARYDLIVFGKGAEGFLTPARLTALQGFVRDHGGAVLFARGKPYSGKLPGLTSMEPVEWGETSGGGVHFQPVADAAAGLFGASLPAPEDEVWQVLTPLEDVRGIAQLRPFARVLAEGTVPGAATRYPLLISRRYGRGTVAALNGDGLWRWDFQPVLRERGAVYQQFWVQLPTWCATWSEFRAGEDYAVRLREATASPGTAVRAVIAYRGPASPEPKPRLVVHGPGAAPAKQATATALPGAEGGKEWAAVFAPEGPGRYEFRVMDDAHPNREQGGAVLEVPAPLQEADDLRPDLSTLTELAQGSGGRIFSSAKITELAHHLAEVEDQANRGQAKWDPLWTNGWMALAVALTLGGEWWLRRREGLL